MAETYDDILQNDSEKDANVRVHVRRKRALSVKIKTMILIVSQIISDIFCVLSVLN
jgi:hypothetical protein